MKRSMKILSTLSVALLMANCGGSSSPAAKSLLASGSSASFVGNNATVVDNCGNVSGANYTLQLQATNQGNQIAFNLQKASSTSSGAVFQQIFGVVFNAPLTSTGSFSVANENENVSGAENAAVTVSGSFNSARTAISNFSYSFNATELNLDPSQCTITISVPSLNIAS